MTSAPTQDATALTHHIQTRHHARHSVQLPMRAGMVEPAGRADA